MSLERLWAGWRGAYVSGALAAGGGAGDASAPPACVLCRITGPGDDGQQFVLWRGALCAAVLNAYPYNTGHLMVAPVAHVGELEDLAVPTAGELWAGVTQAVRAVKAAYRPGGVNVGLNLGRAAGAGVPGHVHVHVLPRWDGDTNFMTSLADTRVLPESLADTWAKLRAAWPTA